MSAEWGVFLLGIGVTIVGFYIGFVPMCFGGGYLMGMAVLEWLKG